MPPPRSTRRPAPRVRTFPLGDTAVLAELGTRLDTALNTRAIALATALKKRRDMRPAHAGAGRIGRHRRTSDRHLSVADARRLAPDRPNLGQALPARSRSALPVPCGRSREVLFVESMTGVLRVVVPGLFTTVQDLGRPNAIAAGVPPGGAMDRFAHRAGNLLVGNAEAEASLECTITGPTLVATHSCVIAIPGADFA